jgi:hypothetical protein
MKHRLIVVNDTMQRGYRYVLSELIGTNFAQEFQTGLDPEQMLKLGVFGGKYMTDARMSFSAIGSRKPNSHRSDTILLSISGSPLVSHYRYGVPKGGSIRMIPAAGFNGIAAISSGGG